MMDVNMSAPASTPIPLEFDAPCCYSVRECSVRKLYVVGFRGKPKVLKEIGAVRCGRGITKKIKFYPSNDVILISYYVSNRGVHHITILWKPQNISEEQATKIVREVLGIALEEKVSVIVSTS
jgi:hypothetical protein